MNTTSTTKGRNSSSNNFQSVQFKDNRYETNQLKKLQQLTSTFRKEIPMQRVKYNSNPIQFVKDGATESQSTVPIWSLSPHVNPFDRIKERMSQDRAHFPAMYWRNMMQHITNPTTDMPYNPMHQMALMQDQFTVQYPWMMPHLYSVNNSVVKQWSKGKDFASTQVDQGMQWVGHKMLNISRDNFKAKHYPEDSYMKRFKKYGWNAGIDASAMLASPIIHATSGFAHGIGEKIGESTWDRVHPRHMWSIMQHPEFIGHYFSQRKEQLMQPVRFYQDPRSFSSKKYAQLSNSFLNLHSHYSALDSGVMGSINHGGRSLVDFTQDNIAPGLGVALASFAMYNSGKRKERTTQAMDYMFPRDTLHGRVARILPNRLMFAKPLSKLRGNPAFSAALITYLMGTSLGKNREDMLALEKEDPAMYKRLVENYAESYGSGTNRGFRESIERTSKRNIVEEVS